MRGGQSASPEDVLVETWGERVGQLIAEEAEVVGIQRGSNAGSHLAQHLAEHIHKLALVSYLQ